MGKNKGLQGDGMAFPSSVRPNFDPEVLVVRSLVSSPGPSIIHEKKIKRIQGLHCEKNHGLVNVTHKKKSKSHC